MTNAVTLSAAAPPLRLAFATWGLAAAFYLIGFYQRVAPAVITRELMAEFALNAAALGNLAAFYYYSYVAIQIPSGVLADRWGPRRILTAGAALAAAGTLLFALAGNYATAALGRLMIGGSVGVAFVCMLKLAGHWFAPQRFAMISGLALACGILGAVSAGLPLRLLVDAFGWRSVLGVSALITALLAGAIWLAVRDDPGELGYASFGPETPKRPAPLLASLARAVRIPNVWLVSLVSGSVSGPTLTFAGLWGVPYLSAHYGISTAQAALITSLLLVCWAVAGPAVGALSDRMRKRKPIYAAGAILAMAGWSGALLWPGLSLPMLVVLLCFTGVVSASVMVGFAIAKESTPAALAGTAGGITNMGNMLGGMVMQPVVGWILDRYWKGEMADGGRIYDLAAYRAGFAFMLIWLGIALLLLFFVRETHCHQQQ